ncbi:hypothetical protein OQA88_12868 [Cercophora sp. LCS_1]
MSQETGVPPAQHGPPAADSPRGTGPRGSLQQYHIINPTEPVVDRHAIDIIVVHLDERPVKQDGDQKMGTPKIGRRLGGAGPIPSREPAPGSSKSGRPGGREGQDGKGTTKGKPVADEGQVGKDGSKDTPGAEMGQGGENTTNSRGKHVETAVAPLGTNAGELIVSEAGQKKPKKEQQDAIQRALGVPVARVDGFRLCVTWRDKTDMQFSVLA